jgi:hypothetical protein
VQIFAWFYKILTIKCGQLAKDISANIIKNLGG